jgi:hypothetical protein
MLDNHDSHERSAPIARAIADGIVTIALPSHRTHLAQMLDLGFFKSLKACWKAAVVSDWLDSVNAENAHVSKDVFFMLMNTACSNACKPETAIKAWKKMGLEFRPRPAQMSGRHLDRGGNTHANIIVINRLAIADSQLGGSELRDARAESTAGRTCKCRGEGPKKEAAGERLAKKEVVWHRRRLGHAHRGGGC